MDIEEFIQKKELDIKARVKNHFSINELIGNQVPGNATYILKKAIKGADADLMREFGFREFGNGFVKKSPYLFCPKDDSLILFQRNKADDFILARYKGKLGNEPLLEFDTSYDSEGERQESKKEVRCFNDVVEHYGHPEGNFKVKIIKARAEYIILEYLGVEEKVEEPVSKLEKHVSEQPLGKILTTHTTYNDVYEEMTPWARTALNRNSARMMERIKRRTPKNYLATQRDIRVYTTASGDPIKYVLTDRDSDGGKLTTETIEHKD